MNCYRSGRRAEYRSADWLRKLGFVVLRTAGSHGLADLVALGKGGVVLVQVKYGRRPGQKEINRFRRAALDVCEHVRLDLHHWRKRAREPELIFCGRAAEGRFMGTREQAFRELLSGLANVLRGAEVLGLTSVAARLRGILEELSRIPAGPGAKEEQS
jgi:predicted RNA binding protein YcfA (HicA-like mRNA interferase family)